MKKLKVTDKPLTDAQISKMTSKGKKRLMVLVPLDLGELVNTGGWAVFMDLISEKVHSSGLLTEIGFRAVGESLQYS